MTTIVDIPPGAVAVVREWCACGVDILAASRSDADVLEAVQRHHAEPVHERWAAIHGFRGYLAEAVALMQVADEMAADAGRSAVRPTFRADRRAS